MQGQKVSVIFDGTSRIGEAMAVILRFADKDWEIQHHLIVSQLFAKSMTGEEIACELTSVLQLQYDVGSSSQDHAVTQILSSSTILPYNIAKDKADDLLAQPTFPISSADQEFLDNLPADAYLF